MHGQYPVPPAANGALGHPPQPTYIPPTAMHPGMLPHGAPHMVFGGMPTAYPPSMVPGMYAPTPMGMMQPPVVAVGDPQPPKIYATYVKHPSGLKEETLLQILKACGESFLEWRPNIDPSTNKPKNFGFAEYSQLQDLARAIRVLSEVEMLDQDTREHKKLIAKADRTTTALVVGYEKQFGIDNSKDAPALDAIRAILGSPKEQKAASSFLDSVLSGQDSASASKEDLIIGSTDKPDSAPDSETANRQDKDGHDEKTSNEKSTGRKQASTASSSTTTIEEEEERELKELERRKADLDRIYKERVRRWEVREQRSIKLRVETERRQADAKMQLDKTRVARDQFLSNFDDDLEDKKGEDDWFVDRQRWVDKRQYILKPEVEQDDRDRQAASDKGSSSNKRTRSSSPSRRERKKNSSKAITWRDLHSQLADLLAKSLRFLNPLAEENANMNALYSFPIAWDLLDDTIVHKRVSPLIDQRITNFLGGSEPDLVEFILDAVLPKNKEIQSHSQVLEEIKVAFGEGEDENKEAQELVRLVWQTIIWETEKRKLVEERDVSALDKPLEEVSIEECLSKV